MAMDGQYTCLNVQRYMEERLMKNVNLSWDPMHRIELASNDSISDIAESKIIPNIINVIQETMIKFKLGNNFEILFSEKELCDTFYTPKVFKDMKFVTYSSEVFKTFVNDFKAFISASLDATAAATAATTASHIASTSHPFLSRSHLHVIHKSSTCY